MYYAAVQSQIAVPVTVTSLVSSYCLLSLQISIGLQCGITLKNQLVKVKYAFNLEKLLICWDLNFTNHINFQSLESCGSR